ncbi:MAG: 4-alpha-glucanotransferase [Myxococcota bacterium]|nr:4-alpha-glucanotransferase [Myxococcota bacterium]
MLRQPLDADAARDAGTAPARRARKEAQRRRRRAGVLIPLFSIRTATGWGLGEIADISRFASWAGRAGFSVLQLLPVNEVSGADASPYSAISAFALDPVYLSLDECEDFIGAGGRKALPSDVQKQLEAAGAARLVDWPSVRAIKKEAIAIAFDRFLREEWNTSSPRAAQLTSFMRENRSWLDEYALFSVLHEKFGKSWLDWPAGWRDRDPAVINAARNEHRDALLRASWTQWQLDRQWRKARRDADAAGIELMGDLPFMVGVDSADVWSNRSLFQVDKHVGTPPDEFSPTGQDWGLPVYDWDALQRDEFSWIRGRSMRAGTLFSLYRLDHVIGLYRTYYRSVDGQTSGFTPGEEREQLRLGETLMRIMGRWGEVVAEDLGTVPPFLRPSLERLGIPGYRVLRWEKDGDRYRPPATWPTTSVATNATHDTETTAEWYDSLSEDARAKLRELPSLTELDPGKPFDERTRDLLLAAVYGAPSTLSIVPFQDAMGTRERINVPATVNAVNWSYRMDRTVDDLLSDQANTDRLARIAADAGRSPSNFSGT